MTIALPGVSKGRLSGLLSKRRAEADRQGGTTTRAKKPLQGHQIAKLFAFDANAETARPAKLNDSEKQDRDRLGSLRGALYSKD